MDFSISRDVIIASNSMSQIFLSTYSFYLDYVDKLYSCLTKMGVDRLSSLTEEDNNLYKSFYFMLNSAITTSYGILILFSHNLYSDTYSLIRMLHEISTLFFYGNESRLNKIEIYDVFYKSSFSGKEQGRHEFKLIKKAEHALLAVEPSFSDFIMKLNNFGSHISREKIVLGNISLKGKDAIGSSINNLNFNNKELILGLELFFLTMLFLIEQYAKNLLEYNAITDDTIHEINSIRHTYLTNISPRLQKMVIN